MSDEVSDKHVLGPLCKRGHRWNGTEQSLRYRSTRQCVACMRLRNDDYALTYYEEHAEKIRAKARDYYWQNRDRLLQQMADYRNTDGFKQSARSYKARNRTSLLLRNRQWRRENREHVSDYN